MTMLTWIVDRWHWWHQWQDVQLEMSSRWFKELDGSSKENLELIHQYIESMQITKVIKD